MCCNRTQLELTTQLQCPISQPLYTKSNSPITSLHSPHARSQPRHSSPTHRTPSHFPRFSTTRLLMWSKRTSSYALLWASRHILVWVQKPGRRKELWRRLWLESRKALSAIVRSIVLGRSKAHLGLRLEGTSSMRPLVEILERRVWKL